MAVRKKRSIASGTTYSRLAAVARKELLIGDGLVGVAKFEREHGAFSDVEATEADTWANDAIRRSRRSGSRRRGST